MVIYKCDLCKFVSSLKGNYTQHLKTKKHAKNLCKIKENNTKDKKTMEMTTNDHKMTTNFQCEYCDSLFTTKAHKRRHKLHYCKNNYNLEKKIIELEEKHEKEKKELYAKIEQLIDKVGNTTNNITNNTQNIILNNYGNEDLTHITDNDKTQLIKIPYYMIPKMIEAVHFNNEKPENKNIVLPNKNDNKLKVYSGNKWIYKNKDETITNLVDGKYTLLDQHFDSLEKTQNLSPFVKTNYLKFRKYYDEGDKEIIEQLKKECDLVLLNNR